MSNKKYYSYLAINFLALVIAITSAYFAHQCKLQRNDSATPADTTAVDTIQTDSVFSDSAAVTYPNLDDSIYYEFYEILPTGDTIFYGEDDYGI